MPTSVYREILEDGTAGEVFELVQRMAHPAIEVHPTTGSRCRMNNASTFFRGQQAPAERP